MPSRGLSPDVALSIEISAVMSRNKYTDDPAPVIAELYETAGDRIDLLTTEVGGWVGYYEDDYTRVLTTALRALPLDLADEIARGLERRGMGHHSTRGFTAPR
ncbi:hypothetical protein QE375_001579 [Microbacterium foliorum]|uniref:Uncharacterized protein n=1 Tax=Microbacterium foliorum TaxID=104336 RepID=A0ABU1HPR3_9MICO|nr:hypothetical protein [Microbacterium foliorum]MDR6142025.1 hypothetical protein [Microbacterium foliorum]